jgi:TldD protein
MIAELEALRPLGEEMSRRARAAGVLMVWRVQSRSVRSVVVKNGKTEGTAVASSAGHGVQIATDDGRNALASRDDLRPDAALKVLDHAVEIGSRAGRLGITPGERPPLQPLCGRAVPSGLDEFSSLDLERVARRLIELESRIATDVPGVQLRLSFRAELDAWRVFRDDGTDVLFAMPRCTLGMRATGTGAGARHGVSSQVFSPMPGLPWDDDAVNRFLRRATRSARLALSLPDAPAHPAGSFPLVIDYALAKGLAHEAFGHASEADGFRSSVLAERGRFRTGADVGAEHVSIIDEPVPEDHAWQPFSANGVKRERVVLVDHGRLAEPLTDLWSAGPAGARLTGAGRAESFHQAPQPRMTNIRIEVDDPLPATGAFEEYGPLEVRDLLQSAGVFRRHPKVCFLSGYSGGQVNPTSGDFVFNCKAIYVLSGGAIVMHKPAIFSGSMFGALHSVREAFGPLELDALGHCGKWGQSVPSSGGSHYFLMLDPDPTVKLGGNG